MQGFSDSRRITGRRSLVQPIVFNYICGCCQPTNSTKHSTKPCKHSKIVNGIVRLFSGGSTTGRSWPNSVLQQRLNKHACAILQRTTENQLQIGAGKSAQSRLGARQMPGQLRHHAVSPFRRLDLAADHTAQLPTEIDQRRIHRLHRPLAGGGDQLWPGPGVGTRLAGRQADCGQDPCKYRFGRSCKFSQIVVWGRCV